ncbi:T6SS effector BTH_I2691 family protein [Pseudomonas sp. HR96]|uniref:T6SS effector BTH_I2691 family protein n=1 Tax=Pseudomonas sp. HR96 TaxID=1027966 RepID=UPI002A7569E3|nr:T6SS effector BTH_I2691 family protein [Pseudomonas sp. HR96]WPP01493.1 T6SS effector BTH_I2691 family protein [Pseudomonas sp. HR96]
MTLASHTRTATTECAPSIKGCRVCQRPGLAILPLRRSLVPKPHLWKHLPEPEISDTELGLRVLRAGYLYVLLDDRVWQAYQVTVDGYLRQFNPYQPRYCNERRLTRACVNRDHDIPASFLNIDTDQYRTASFAFSSDPWPVSVLDAYKALRNIERMQMIDLATARDNPTRYGDYLTPEEPWILKQVYEYRDFVPGFPSVHGFHSRGHRQSAIRNYLRTARVHPTLGPGVLAIEVDDDVGLVQEYNAMRASWAHARQVWLEEPERAYQHQTSQILLAIRALHRQWANAKVPVKEPNVMPPDWVIPGAWAIERQRRVDQLALESDQRLEERYDEPKRADFQKTYDTVLQVYQKQIDHYGERYAKAFLAADFHVAMAHDYDPDDRQSAIAYSKTMALCLSGGISEAPGNASGPTVMLWQELLQDPQSPIYKALLMRDKHLVAALLPSFDATGVDDWNDSGKLYAALQAAINSDEAGEFKRRNLQEAMAQMLAALNAASTRLKAVLGAGVECAVSRLNSATQFLYNGLSLIELHVPMRLGDYYALQSRHIRELQHKHANGADRPRPKSRDKVQPLILGGVLSLSVMNPKIADLVVQVSVWVEGTVEDLKKALSAESRLPPSDLGLDASARLVPVGVGLATLDPAARKALEGVQMTLPQARKWVRTGFGGVMGVAGSAEVLLAVGGLYLMHDSMGKNLEAARKAVGDRSIEAEMALAGSALGVIGGGIELIGIALETGLKGAEASSLITSSSVIASRMASLADRLIRVGGMAIAVSSFHDAAQAVLAASRAANQGDTKAEVAYFSAAMFSAVAGVTGGVAAVLRITSIAGPMGIAIIVGLLGYALYNWAQHRESSPIELWAKRCFFGVADEIPKIHWAASDSGTKAIAELNAITMALDGELELKFEHLGYAPGNIPIERPHWFYRIRLPHYSVLESAYRWSLLIHRKDDKFAGEYIAGEIVARSEQAVPEISTQASRRPPATPITLAPTSSGYRLKNPHPFGLELTDQSKDGAAVNFLEFSGSLQGEQVIDGREIEAVTLSVTYWPEKAVVDGYAEIVRTRHMPGSEGN